MVGFNRENVHWYAFGLYCGKSNMTSRDGSDVRCRAEKRKNHLQSEVSALRDELEKGRIGEEDRIQQAAAKASDENKQLKATITALRDELEKGRIGEEDRIQQAAAKASDENKQLKATITALRDELEKGELPG